MVHTPRKTLPPGTHDAGVIASYDAADRALSYRIVAAAEPRYQLVCVHGLESHGTWFLDLANHLRDLGCTTYLLDRRGSGLNRDGAAGDTHGCDVLLDDLSRFRQLLGDQPIGLLAFSWGAKLASVAAMQHPEWWTNLTLVTPGLRALVDLPWHHKLLVRASLLAGGGATVPVPIAPEMFTTSPRYLAFIREDPWRLRRVTARFCIASRGLDDRLAEPGAHLAVPCAAVFAGRDRIIDNDAAGALIAQLQRGAAITMMPGAEHAVWFEHPGLLADRIVQALGGVLCTC
jgi:pimeloyl-ACP methyl ester carboxylesterase